jgi:hypothetical protein
MHHIKGPAAVATRTCQEVVQVKAASRACQCLFAFPSCCCCCRCRRSIQAKGSGVICHQEDVIHDVKIFLLICLQQRLPAAAAASQQQQLTQQQLFGSSISAAATKPSSHQAEQQRLYTGENES